MSVAPISDDDLLRRLPLPLAQLYRRALNGKTPVDRHHNAYYLAEATLKLAASARIAALLAGLDHQSPLARSLEQLCLPSVGHWVGFLRESSEYLRARPDSALLPLAPAHEALTRHEALPAVREFAERASRGVDDEQPPIAADAARAASRRGILGFFDLVAGYRNQVFGHGAQRPPAFYDALGGLLLAASAEVLRSDALFADLTLAVARLTSGDSGRSLRVEWQGLQGFASLMLASDVVGPEPDPSDEAARQAAGRVYLVARGVRVPLHPLVVYREDRSERERLGSLNRTVEAGRSAGVGEVRRCDYLDYATGDLIGEVDARRELAELLARLRGRPATPTDVDRVILEGQAGSGERLPPPDLGAGAIIGDFVLEGKLGRGGMGVVYRARQRSLNRTVALKVLPPSMAADPVSLGRFRREIAALARCDHPNLVKILTSGADGDRHFYAMELVEGMDLAALFEVLAAWNRSAKGHLREGHLPAAVSTSSDMARRRQESQPADAEPLPALEPVAPALPPELDTGRTLFECLGTLFADAAAALAHLHSRGVIHRDIKPANLMLTLDGRRLVVMDLGLAQLRDRSQSLTADGVKFVGTLRYTSPEQLQRNLREVDERTDVYGLGATLYEMATLAPIFDGDTPNRLIEQVLHQEPKSLRSVEPTIPKDLAAIALHCLDKDRSQRYANARDLAEDLRHFAHGEPVSVREPGLVERALKWARRRPAIAALSATVCLVALIGFCGVIWQWRRALDEARRADDNSRIAIKNAGIAKKNEDMAKSALADTTKANEKLKTSLEERRVALDRANRGAYFAHIILAQREWGTGNFRSARAILAEPREAELRGIEWSYLDRRWNVAPEVYKHANDEPFSVNMLTYRPDGKLLAACGMSGKLLLWDAGNDRSRLVLKGHGTRTIFALAFGPDGRQLFSLIGEEVFIWDTTDGHLVNRLRVPGEKPFANSMALAPDGHLIATAGDEGVITIWEIDSGKIVSTIENEPPFGQGITSLAFSPKGEKLASADRGGYVRVWDKASGKRVSSCAIFSRRIVRMAFSPSEHDLRIVATESGEMVATESGVKGISAVIIDAQTGKRLVALEGHTDVIVGAAFIHEGEWVVTASEDGTVRVWDAGTGRQRLLRVPGSKLDVHFVSPAPDLVTLDKPGDL